MHKTFVRFIAVAALCATIASISAVSQLNADTIAWPVSIVSLQEATPSGPVHAQSVSVVSPSDGLAAGSSIQSKPVSIVTPTFMTDTSYMALPASVAYQGVSAGDPDLVGQWHLDGDWLDASGNGSHGTPFGGATFSTTSKVGSRSGNFDGSDDYTEIPNSANVNVSDNLTIEAWINPGSDYNGYATHLINKWGASDTNQANYVLYYFGTTSGVNRQIRFYANAGGTWKAISPGYTVELNTWYHVALTYNSTTGGTLYINGVAQGAPVGSGTLKQNSYPLRFGGTPSYYFKGLLDEIAIYKRTLTAGEIAQHYAAGVTGDPNTPVAPTLDAGAAYSGSTTITLSGTRPANTSIWVNNKKIAAADAATTWQGNYLPLQLGPNILNVTALDETRLLQSATVSRSVFYETVAPIIESSIPTNNSNTAQVVTNVSLTLYDANAGVDLNASMQGATVKNAAGQTIAGAWTTSGSRTMVFTPTVPFPADTYTVTIQATDMAGNSVQRQVIFTNHDTSAPVSKATIAGTKDSAGWYATPVTVTLSADDSAGGAGVSRIDYSLDNGGTWQEYAAPFVIETDGKTTMQFRATDATGNQESPAKVLEVKVNKTGLVGKWQMDGNWNDASVVGTNALPRNGVAFTASARIGADAGLFNGTDAYLEVPNSSGLNPPKITVEAWAKSSIATWSSFGSLVSKRNAYILAPAPGSTSVRFYGWLDGTWQSVTYSDPSLDITQWHHYVGTYDGYRLNIYVDGVKSSYAYTGSVDTTDTGPLFIGWDDGQAGRYFNGSIDEVAIYNRALSDTEVLEHYRNIAIGVPTVDPVTSPVNTPSIALSGTKPANSSVVVSSGSTSVEIAPQTDAVAWAATTWQGSYTLTSGVNALNITAKDADGYHSQATTVSVALDDTAPTIVSSDPVNGGIFKAPLSTITVNLADAHSPLDLAATVAQATVKTGSNLDVAGSWTTNGTGTTGSALFTAASPMGEGSYSVILNPTDTFANSKTVSVGFTVDMTAPVPPTIAPIASPSNSTSRTVTGTKSADSISVAVTCPGGTVGPVSYPTATSWSVVISGLQEGVRTVTASAIDSAGNPSTAATASFTVDLTPPTKPVINAPITPTNSTSITLTGTKEANSYLYLNNAVTTAPFADTAWSATVALSEGSNPFTVFAKDEAGNQGQSVTTTVVRDTAPPTILSSSPTASAIKGSVGSVSISFTSGAAAADLTASLTNAVVKKGTAIIDGVWSVAGDSILFTPAATLAEGVYTVTVYPVDTLGNKGSATFNFTVDQGPPTVQTLTVSPASPLKAGSATFTLTFGEAMDTTVSPVVTFGSAPYAVTGSWTDNRTWRGTATLTAAMGDGSYAATVKGAKDVAGNSMADQSAWSFVLDTTPPPVPTTNAVTPLTKTASQLLTGSKAADTAIVINGQVRVALSSATSWSYSYPLVEGANTLTIVARDAAGNDSAAIAPAPVITLDTTPPLFTVDVYKNPATTATQVISGKKEAGSVVKLNGTVIIDATDQSADWSYSLTLVDGITNHLVFTAIDAIGNVTTKTLDILFDSAPPVALGAGMLTVDGSGKGSEVTLAWPSYPEPTGLAYYRVFQSLTDITTVSGLTPLATVNKGSKAYKATGLTQGTRYYFAVVPVSSSGNSDPVVHSASTVPVDTLAPEEITGLTAAAGYNTTDGNTVTLSWTPSVNGTGDLADQVVYLDSGNGYDAGTAIGKTAISYTRKGLNDASLYKFEVRVKDQLGHESQGAHIQVSTRLANPTGLTAIPGNNKVTLAWTPVASPYVKLYNIYRLKSDTPTTDTAGMTLLRSQTGTTFTDDLVVNGSTYQYAVTVLNSFGAERSTVQSVPATPRGDTTGPVISGPNLTTNQVVTAPITITASASDAESAMDRIELSVDGTKVATATGNSLSHNWNVIDTSDGSHTVKVAAYDAPGNLTEKTIPVVVSLAPPAPPVISTTFSGPITQQDISVSGTTQAGATVFLKLNGVVTGQQVATTGAFTFNTVALVEGSNVIAVKAANRGGDSGYSSDLRVTVDSGPPPAPTGLTAKVLAGGAVQFSWQVGTGELPTGYNLYEATAPFAATTDAGVHKVNTTPIAYLLKEHIPANDAMRFYAVTAVDGAGNESLISGVVPIAADRVSPSAATIQFSLGGTTPADNVYGSGQLNVTLTVSEPLKELPFLSIEPQSGSPLVVLLRQLDETRYDGSVNIDAAAPHGSTVWKFSGKDQAGNRGTSQGTGPTFDLRGPAADIIAPKTTLKTSAGPVAVSVVFDEPVTNIPTLELSSKGVSSPVSGLTTSDGGLHWSGTLDPAALPDGSGQFVLTNARDRFDNSGTTVKSGGSILLYATAPPAPAVPTGLSAKAAKGGVVNLAWTKVNDALGYKLYRKAVGDSESTLIHTAASGSATTYADLPAIDGAYAYSVSSVGLLDVESARSDEATATADRQSPASPTGLALRLSGNGVVATWDAVTAPEEVPAVFRLYRANGTIIDLAGLTPAATGKTSTVTDPTPDSSQRFYAVTALDALGNESAPSPTVEITFPVAPVRNLLLTRVDSGRPALSWEAGEAGLQGFHIYRNGSRITQVPTVSTTYSDGYYSGGTVSYGISAVNTVGTESPVREVVLPSLTIGLKEGTTLRRGVLETIPLIVTLPADAAAPLTVDALTLKIGPLPESSQPGPFTLNPGVPLEVAKVAASEANAPPLEAVVATAVLTPASGTTVRITQSSVASILGAGSALELFNDPLVRGTTAKVRLKVNNLGSARTEFLTAENGGPTGQVTVSLKDQDGNVLAQGRLNQRSGAAIVDAGAYTTARLNPTESFLSEPITFTVPVNAPYKVSLEAVIGATYYHYGQDDQVVAPGLSQSVEAAIADVSYSALAATDKTTYRQGESVVISGQAISTTSGQPMSLVPVKIGLSLKGFDRFFTVSTDEHGAFSYAFTPAANETGSFSVWASHPDLNNRTIQAQFSVIGLQVTPDIATIRMLRGNSQDIPVSVVNIGGSELTGLTLTGSASGGITATVVGAGSDRLAPGETRSVTFRVTAAANAADTGLATLDIATAQGLGDRLVVNLSLVSAMPVIATSPSYIDTGLVRGNQRVETITLRNTGLETLRNARIEGPSTAWLSLTIDRALGDIPAGQAKTIGIMLNPGETVAQGTYNDRLVIYADNHVPYTYNIQATVTSSGVGNVQFYLLDELNEKVPNATINLQNQALPELYYTLRTDAQGNNVSTTDIPEGRYSYSVSAPNHKSSSGSFVIIPGVWVTVPVLLEFNLVNIEWSVTPVVIEDRYQVTINQTFVTNVPAPVLVTEPAGITLPEMTPGQVFNGEFTLSNYGLVTLKEVKVDFPRSFGDYDVELLSTMPATLNAMQKVTVAYRVTRRLQTAGLAGSCTTGSVADEVTGYGGGGCFSTFTVTTSGSYEPCPTIPQSVQKSAPHTVSIPTTCPTGTGGGSIVSPPQTYTGGATQSSSQTSGGGWAPGAVPTLLSDDEECGNEIPKCTGADCAKVCTNSQVNLGTGTYEDSQTDLDLKTNGLTVGFDRHYTSRWTQVGTPPSRPAVMVRVEDILIVNGGSGSKCSSSSEAAKNKNNLSCFFPPPPPPKLTTPPPQAFGWTSPWFAKINEYENYISYFDGRGQMIYFLKQVDGSFRPASKAEEFVREAGITITRTATGLQVREKSGQRRNFAQLSTGGWYVLTGIEDPHGNRFVCNYDASENLISIDDGARVRIATLTYTGGYISKLTDRDGREVNYRIDEKGRLVEVTGIVGEKSTYEYDQVGKTAGGPGYLVINGLDGSVFNRLLKKTDPEGHVTTIEYKPQQLVVTKVTEPGGGVRTFDYDFQGYTFYSTDPRGNTTVFKVNVIGKLVSMTRNGRLMKKIDYLADRVQVITDEGGNSTRIQTNEQNDPIRITDGEGNETRIEYNQDWKIARITDPMGKVTSFDYNTKQDLIKVTDAKAQETLLDYDNFGNVTRVTRGSGAETAITTYEYDARGNAVKVTDPENNVTTLGYDSYGHVNSITDANNNVTLITNDPLGQPLIVEDPLGNKRRFAYDKKGHVTTVTDELNRVSSYTYDFKGRVTSAVDPLNNRTDFTYDGEGNLIEKKELPGTASERTTTFAYDIFNRLERVTDPVGNTTRYDYSGTAGCSSCSSGASNAIPAMITDPLGKVTNLTFDKAGRIKSLTDPMGYVTTLGRDSLGKPTRQTDANGKATQYAYDELGRLIKQTDANNGETVFDYDSLGNLTSLTDPNGNGTTFVYDKAGRKTDETRPLGQSTQYAYYPNGLLHTITDARGQTTTYVYDKAGRLTEITYADTKKETFGYEAAGNLTSYSAPGVSGAIVYDELGRKTSETVTIGGITKSYGYTYNATGTKATYTSPEGTVYTYGYDKNNQPTSITFGSKTISLAYSNRLMKTTLTNGITTDYGYNANSWLSAIETKRNSATIASSQYGFDKVGNITQKTADALTTSYGYDSTYQVTSAGSESFSYDRTGNRTNSGYSHNANNELLTTATASFTHDANGNTNSKTVGGQTTNYIYNAANRLETVQLPDGRTATYSYDPFGRRIKKQVGSDITWYLYSDEGLIGEYDATGSLKKGYGWLPDGIWGANPQFQFANGSYYFYKNDHLGTPQKLTDEAGNIIWQATYTAFGQAQVDPASTITNNLRFPGQYADEETRLHYNWNRYYDPDTGRYMQVDPIGFFGGDENLYRYVGNRPQNAYDPEGLYAADDLLYDISNVLIGIGDTVSLGLTAKIRQMNGTDGSVDKCTGAYKAGQVAGTAIDLVVGGVVFKGGIKLVSGLRKIPKIPRVERVVIGRGADLSKSGALRPGEFRLEWPSKLPDFKAEWKMNSGLLRQEMRKGLPIRDASPGNTGGLFLNAERNLLQSKGWSFDPATNYWMPPGAP